MKSAIEIYQEYFTNKNEEHLAKYQEWKKTRPAKIAQTKALRQAKASAKGGNSNE
jgi:hypothetical protein